MNQCIAIHIVSCSNWMLNRWLQRKQNSSSKHTQDIYELLARFPQVLTSMSRGVIANFLRSPFLPRSWSWESLAMKICDRWKCLTYAERSQWTFDLTCEHWYIKPTRYHCLKVAENKCLSLVLVWHPSILKAFPNPAELLFFLQGFKATSQCIAAFRMF